MTELINCHFIAQVFQVRLSTMWQSPHNTTPQIEWKCCDSQKADKKRNSFLETNKLQWRHIRNVLHKLRTYCRDEFTAPGEWRRIECTLQRHWNGSQRNFAPFKCELINAKYCLCVARIHFFVANHSKIWLLSRWVAGGRVRDGGWKALVCHHRLHGSQPTGQGFNCTTFYRFRFCRCNGIFICSGREFGRCFFKECHEIIAILWKLLSNIWFGLSWAYLDDSIFRLNLIRSLHNIGYILKLHRRLLQLIKLTLSQTSKLYCCKHSGFSVKQQVFRTAKYLDQFMWRLFGIELRALHITLLWKCISVSSQFISFVGKAFHGWVKRPKLV